MTIRMFKDVATFMRLLLMYVRDNGTSLTSIIRYYEGGNAPIYLSPDARREIYLDYKRLHAAGFQYEFDLDRLITELGDQLRAAGNPNSDVSIIDEICRILNFPYSRNAISNEMLKRLRRAIMMPDEVANLRALVDQKENRCIGCGKLLLDGQVVSLQTDNRTNERVIYCTTCVLPEGLPCKECGEVHELSKNQKAAISRGAKCTRQAVPDMPVIEAPQVPPAAQRVNFAAAPNLRLRNPIRRPVLDRIHWHQEIGRPLNPEAVQPNPFEDGPQVAPANPEPRPVNPEGRHDQ